VGFSVDLARWNPEPGYRPFSHNPPSTKRPIRQTPASATRGDIKMDESSALDFQPDREGMEASAYVDRRIVLKGMVFNTEQEEITRSVFRLIAEQT
jgi:hypothetical protein